MVDSRMDYFKVYESTYHLKILEPNTTNFDLSKPTPRFLLDSAVLCSAEKVVETEQSHYQGNKYKFAVITCLDFDSYCKHWILKGLLSLSTLLVANQIMRQQANYIIGLKANQDRLYEKVAG